MFNQILSFFASFLFKPYFESNVSMIRSKDFRKLKNGFLEIWFVISFIKVSSNKQVKAFFKVKESDNSQRSLMQELKTLF